MDHSKMAGHDHRAMIADFLRQFWVCLALSVPLVAGSTMFQHLVGYHFTFPYSTPVLLVLATAIFGYGGWPFLSGTVAEMRSRHHDARNLSTCCVHRKAAGHGIATRAAKGDGDGAGTGQVG